MLYVLLGALVLLIVFAPQWWIRYVMYRHSGHLDGMPGTGGELARHLVETLQLGSVSVEQTEPHLDHYDPSDRTVRLSPMVYSGKSLTAVAIAVHEVGHALQHARGDRSFELRTSLAPTIHRIERVGIALLTLMPFVTLLTRVPATGVIMVIAGVGILFARVAFHALTLPVEIDASFNKALPIITEGRYVAPHEHWAVRRVLRAAAYTYVAAALADVLSIWRWLLILRRG